MKSQTVAQGSRLIALCGPMGVGKSEVARAIMRVREGTFIDAWAADLKALVERMFGWDNGVLNGDSEDSREFRDSPCPVWSAHIGRPFTPREAMQVVGTDLFRRLSPDIWVRCTMARVQHRLNSAPNSLCVLADTRFPNERQAVKDGGGIVVQVAGLRPGSWAYRGEQDAAIRHESETALSGMTADYLIPNAGGLDDLARSVAYFMTRDWAAVKAGRYRNIIR